jgi:D-inositol-3-phosphate glycosyltransferase
VKRILIGPAHPLRGGIASFNHALCYAYQRAGMMAEIVTFYLQYPKILFPGKTQIENGPAPEGIKISAPLSSINPFSWYRTARLIRKEQPEYILFQYWMPFMAPAFGVVASRVKRKTKTKVVAVVHNALPHESFPLKKILTRYFFNRCDYFIAMSRSVEQDLKTLTKNKVIRFSPHPIYDIFGEKVSKEKACGFLKIDPLDSYVLFFGIIRAYKGLDLLLRAFADKRIMELGIKLIIAGEFYEDKKRYMDLISEFQLQEKIILHDSFIPNQEVKYYFSAADIVAQTYHSATQSGVAQMAYQFDSPMLVTDVGGLSEIVPHGKVGYVTKKNPKEIADALVDFFTNQRKAEFAKNVFEEKKNFSWEKFVRVIEENFTQE